MFASESVLELEAESSEILGDTVVVELEVVVEPESVLEPGSSVVLGGSVVELKSLVVLGTTVVVELELVLEPESVLGTVLSLPFPTKSLCPKGVLSQVSEIPSLSLSESQGSIIPSLSLSSIIDEVGSLS